MDEPNNNSITLDTVRCSAQLKTGNSCKSKAKHIISIHEAYCNRHKPLYVVNDIIKNTSNTNIISNASYTFLQFPVELWNLTFEYLDKCIIITKLSSVCRAVYNITLLYKNKTFKSIRSSDYHKLTNKNFIDMSFVNELHINTSKKVRGLTHNLFKLKGLTSLKSDFPLNLTLLDIQRLVNLTSIDVPFHNCMSIDYVLETLTNLTHLRCDDAIFGNYFTSSKTTFHNLPNLTSLSLPQSCLITDIGLKIPKLRKLEAYRLSGVLCNLSNLEELRLELNTNHIARILPDFSGDLTDEYTKELLSLKVLNFANTINFIPAIHYLKCITTFYWHITSATLNIEYLTNIKTLKNVYIIYGNSLKGYTECLMNDGVITNYYELYLYEKRRGLVAIVG